MKRLPDIDSVNDSWNPRSPDYNDPDLWMEQLSTQMGDDWLEELQRTGVIAETGQTRADIDKLMTEGDHMDLEDTLYMIAYDMILENPGDYQRHDEDAWEDWA